MIHCCRIVCALMNGILNLHVHACAIYHTTVGHGTSSVFYFLVRPPYHVYAIDCPARDKTLIDLFTIRDKLPLIFVVADSAS